MLKLLTGRGRTVIKFIEAVPTEGIPSGSFSDQIKCLTLYQPLTEESTDVEFVDRARPTVIKFIEAVPTEGIPSGSFSDQIKCLTLYQPGLDDMDEYESF
jgi:hypothetical protein